MIFETMDVAIPLYDGFTALDAVGPYEVLTRMPGANVSFVAEEPGPVRTETRALAMTADRALDDLPAPDILMVPGGLGTRRLLDGGPMVEWVRSAHETSQWTTSVCTGSLLLGAAGVLDGLEATTHWLELETLERFGARPVQRRVVEEGKVMTAAGVSSGIDMALVLVARIAGDGIAQAIQLGIEYDPDPPFPGGSPRTSPPHIVELVRSRARELA